MMMPTLRAFLLLLIVCLPCANSFVVPPRSAPSLQRRQQSVRFVSSVEEVVERFTKESSKPTAQTNSDVQQQQLVFGSTTTTADKFAAVTNTLVVGGLAAAAAYVLLHEKVEALLALYEYGLGKHAPDVTLTAVALETLARLPMDALHSYEALVPTNPVFFKACTSGVAYALGDFISQLYQGNTLQQVDLPRSFRSGAAGFIAHGPLCHYWLLTMETYLDFGGAWWATGLKVTADLTVWSIFLNAAYSSIIGLLAFRNPKDVIQDVQATTWPALRSAWRFWPFVHTISFSHAVPLDLKLLWVDVMEVIWVTILSKVANEDKEKAANAAVVLESNNELENVLEKESSPSAWEVPQKVLAACWPLLAMWPVLYAGYQIEHALGLVH